MRVYSFIRSRNKNYDKHEATQREFRQQWLFDAHNFIDWFSVINPQIHHGILHQFLAGTIKTDVDNFAKMFGFVATILKTRYKSLENGEKKINETMIVYTFGIWQLNIKCEIDVSCANRNEIHNLNQFLDFRRTKSLRSSWRVKKFDDNEQMNPIDRILRLHTRNNWTLDISLTYYFIVDDVDAKYILLFL